MHKQSFRKTLPTALAAVSALAYAGGRTYSPLPDHGPVITAAARFAAPQPGTVSGMVHAVVTGSDPAPTAEAAELEQRTRTALSTLGGRVGPLSHPLALRDAFASYFAFRAAHPDQVHKPYLYFVDYGLPATKPRGFVFDMDALRIVDGPFMVAHGRGSMPNDHGVPTYFSNAFGAGTTSLGLYVAQELYAFVGHSGGAAYRSVGMRLEGVSRGFNDNARARGVVAHGAPYVTESHAGRSEGCPAMEPGRAQRLLPRLANGSLVFLFAPDQSWMTRDPWIARDAADSAIASSTTASSTTAD